ncbi:hypothetical protein GCM10011487_15910 [Steroidobacter agaridevorans]|uniref:Lipoprotein n=1 Tax=Steroidobacter agaridevorans TaxID=2695856 RepID=A0A829Y9J0_9GAMM|nr:hypothetical protein GCM10011487_15910 [Steroidobacter agaridevorans]GFE88596.1 hypothetical protein GCM10011488_35500 [Steroidobacter agaridevorans]
MLRRFALLFPLLLAGCAVYEAPKLPTDQLATLSFEQKPSGLFATGSVALAKIDGKAPSGSTWILRHRSPISVAPGKHTIELSYVVGIANGIMSLWFVAEPGTAYVVRGDSAGYTFRLWIAEERTGRPVGGIVGSSDEPV